MLIAAMASIHASAAPAVISEIAKKSPLTSHVIQPRGVVWKSDQGVANSENLLKPHSGQAVLIEPVPPMVMQPGGSVVIDFGVEIAGSIELFTPMTKEKLVSL